MAGSKKDAKQRRRAKRLADRATQRERHAALVNERSGDPRYLQRVRNADGSTTVTAPDEGGRLQAALQTQSEAFREKFGREMGPEDPVFFDPDADEPTPMDQDAVMDEMRRAAESMPDPQARTYMLAFADCGYIVTEANQHTFSAHEVEAYLDAVERHLT